MQRVDKFGQRELPLVREVAVMSTVLQRFHPQKWRISELNKEYLVSRDRREIVNIVLETVDVESMVRKIEHCSYVSRQRPKFGRSTLSTIFHDCSHRLIWVPKSQKR